uniref:Uncharacterized protein n=1 Tax=Anopheles melas TaxID=34690 RepID=A0A182TG34_9DIPT
MTLSSFHDAHRRFVVLLQYCLTSSVAWRRLCTGDSGTKPPESVRNTASSLQFQWHTNRTWDVSSSSSSSSSSGNNNRGNRVEEWEPGVMAHVNVVNLFDLRFSCEGRR